MLADQLGRHLGVGVEIFFVLVAIELNFSRAKNAFANARGTFDLGIAAKFLVFHGGNFDVDIDAVEKRAGNFGNVALNLRRGAVALARGVAEESARTRVHRGGEHEARREN